MMHTWEVMTKFAVFGSGGRGVRLCGMFTAAVAECTGRRQGMEHKVVSVQLHLLSLLCVAVIPHFVQPYDGL